LPYTENWKYTLINIVATHTATAEVGGIIYPGTVLGGGSIHAHLRIMQFLP